MRIGVGMCDTRSFVCVGEIDGDQASTEPVINAADGGT